MPQCKRSSSSSRGRHWQRELAAGGTLMTVCSLPLSSFTPGKFCIIDKNWTQGFPHSQAVFSHTCIPWEWLRLEVMLFDLVGARRRLPLCPAYESCSRHRVFLISLVEKKSASLCPLIYPSHCFICNIFITALISLLSSLVAQKGE